MIVSPGTSRRRRRRTRSTATAPTPTRMRPRPTKWNPSGTDRPDQNPSAPEKSSMSTSAPPAPTERPRLPSSCPSSPRLTTPSVGRRPITRSTRATFKPLWSPGAIAHLIIGHEQAPSHPLLLKICSLLRKWLSRNVLAFYLQLNRALVV